MYQEIKAQIDFVERVSNHKITIDHIDAHHLILQNKIIEEAFLAIAKEKNIPVRFDPCLSIPATKQIVHPDVFDASFTIVDVRLGKIKEILKKYEDSSLTVELITHSGYVDEYTKTLTSYIDREKELEVLKQAKEQGLFLNIPLISYVDVKENSLMSVILKNQEELKKKEMNPSIDSIMIGNKGKTEKYFPVKCGLHELRSISKVLIALAIGKGVEEGILSLDTYVYPILSKVCDIHNESNISKIKKWKVKHLLTYTAGYDKQMFNEKSITHLDPKEYLSYVLNYPIEGKAGKKYVYNNAELFLLSVLFQEITGENIKDYIDRHIFTPLGIKEYQWDNYDKYCPGGTGLYLKAEDLFKIGQLLINYGKYNGLQIMSPKYIKKMCTTRLKTPYAVKPNRVLPKRGVGYIMHISRDHWAFKDGTNGQYLIINFKKQQLITILSSEPNMSVVTEVLRGII